ncbi:MAG: hypothetical protein GWO24_13500, partial [Akkermansiaceae bacterium]|nr:hypothetical protein [Akkermansiaceae bacterium]
MTRLFPVLFGVLVTIPAAGAAEPKRDVAYDTRHERNVLDYWPAPQSDDPAPV